MSGISPLQFLASRVLAVVVAASFDDLDIGLWGSQMMVCSAPKGVSVALKLYG